jgi:competence protein ComEA
VVLAAVVVVVAVVVVLVGALVSGRGEGAGGTGGVVVRGAPAAGTGGASGAPSPSPSASAGAGVVASSAPGVGPDTGAGRVVVHVLGAVRRSGVVELPASSRVGDALERAGGATDDADLDRLNLARVLTDGERLYVPRVGQQEVPEALGPVADGAAAGPTAAPGAGAGGSGGTADTGGEGTAVVDLNTADQTALETLPGIGPGLAGRIIAWRDEHGRFTAVEDLLDVSGIGDVRFAELRDRVRV